MNIKLETIADIIEEGLRHIQGSHSAIVISEQVGHVNIIRWDMVSQKGDIKALKEVNDEDEKM